MLKTTLKLIVAIVLFLFLTQASSAKLMQPSEYQEGQCELAAKEFQNRFGGELVLAYPFLDDQFVPGRFAGVWINKIYIKHNKQDFYFYYPGQRIFSSREEVISYYSNVLKNKFDNGNIEARIYVFGIDSIPFPLIFNY